MSSKQDWDSHYESGALPWDTGEPDPHLVALLAAETLPKGRALEIGCGTGTNAVWLAKKGYAVVAVDLAPKAVERARARAAEEGVAVDFRASDFLAEDLDAGPFDLVFDRGCFHVFDAADERERFAARVAGLLAPGGRWLSLIGSTEGAPREMGPPRRSARDIVGALEPHLAIVDLQDGSFAGGDEEPRAWRLIAGKRARPAQPSSTHRRT